MQKPELVETSHRGATIHSYDIEGGQTTFHRYLGCYLGNCEFYNNLETARTAVSRGELRPDFPL